MGRGRGLHIGEAGWRENMEWTEIMTTDMYMHLLDLLQVKLKVLCTKSLFCQDDNRLCWLFLSIASLFYSVSLSS